MFAECSECGCEIFRYWCNEYSDPCPECGSVMFWVHHFGYKDIPADKVLMNVVTKKTFDRMIAHHEVKTITTWTREV